jgi:hypothetical protein
MVQRDENKKQMHFVSWKASFSFSYFFIIPFPLHFEDDFEKLEASLP